MSRLKLMRYKETLEKILSRAPETEFFQMIWAVDALQSGRQNLAKRYIEFPREAATTDFESKYRAHPWQLETLANERLRRPPTTPHKSGRTRVLNCSKWHAFARTFNTLLDVENAESQFFVNSDNIFLEIHRLFQRQLPWQRGFFRIPELYRCAFLYSKKNLGLWYKKTYGISIDEFICVGTALYCAFLEEPRFSTSSDLSLLGIDDEMVHRALSRLCATLQELRSQNEHASRENAETLKRAIAYSSSKFRKRPIVYDPVDPRFLICPLPELIAFRITSGLFYDFVSGDSGIRNSIAKNFETYCQIYMRKMYPQLGISNAVKYKFRKNNIESPDLRIYRDKMLEILVECKSTKMTLSAAYSINPYKDAKDKFDELTKGVAQIWRFCSHVRRGLVVEHINNAGPVGIVLTLENWATITVELHRKIIESANDVVAKSDTEIDDIDKIPVVICSIRDLEETVPYVDGDDLILLLRAAASSRYLGYRLPELRKELHFNKSDPKPFPFVLSEILPWWSKLDELREGQLG